jgi:drug/metabolite transporter (DMT)-like permease
MSTKALAASALVLNAFVWGISWWPFRLLQTHGLHPLWATAIIYTLALTCLAALRPDAWRSFGRHPLLWLLVLASGLTNVGFNWAVAVGDVVRVVLLFYLMPAWVVLLAWPILGEKPSSDSLMRLVLALTGVMIVLKAPNSSWPVPQSLADGLALMGGLSFALTNILLRKLNQTPDESRMLAMFGGGAAMSICVALFGMSVGLVQALPQPEVTWITLALFISFAFLAGNLALQYGAAHLSASATSLIMLSEVVFASVSSVVLGTGEFSTRTLLGGALIFLASVLSVVSFRKLA